MNAPRATSALLRSTRATTISSPARRQLLLRKPNTITRRYASDTSVPNPNSSSSSSTSSSSSGGSGSGAVVGGLIGGSLVFLAGYGYYHFSGAKTLVQSVKAADSQFKSFTSQLKQNAPEPNEALDWLRSQAKGYSSFIPGARGYVDSAFDDLDAIRAKHGEEVDGIVREAYNQLKDISGQGVNKDSALKAWDVIQDAVKKIGDLAGDAAQQIMDNHPELKEKVGGNLETLKQLGDQYGPEARKQVDQTWDQIQDVVKSGVSADTAQKIQKIIQDRMQFIREVGEQAWQKGLEKAKPYLDKNPEVKKLVEENKDALKSGNFGELYEKIKQAVESGNTEDLQKYVKNAGQKVKQSSVGQGVESYLKMIPGGDQIFPRIQQLQQIAEKHGKEAENLMKETVGEIRKVLEKKGDEAQKIAENAKKDS